MSEDLLVSASEDSTFVSLLDKNRFDSWRENLTPLQQTWVTQTDFRAETGSTLWLPDANAEPTQLIVGWNGEENLNALGHLAFSLPEGTYRLAELATDLMLLGWCLGGYRFSRYKSPKRKAAKLVVENDEQRSRVLDMASAVNLTRDLINTPAADMLPSDLQNAAEALASEQGAHVQTLVGDSLLQAGYRTIHAVGRASVDAPRLIDMQWGSADHPRVTLVGKGVCFDSGGLNIKGAAGMRTMKKDMGGAAQVLGLAKYIMQRQLPVRLRVLVPAVENAISGNAYRPGDVIETYAGTTVEIDNTDAEGRLVLCDALALAQEEAPELLVDFATLTGAARVAVGAEISAMFCTDDDIAHALTERGAQEDDPVWRLPLHKPYEHLLASNVADTVNSASSGLAGATTAALFLQKFVGATTWIHFDIMAMNSRSRPARPKGGEAMGIRALARYLETRYGQ